MEKETDRPDMEDPFSRAKVMRALIELRRNQPMTMGGFMRAVGYYSPQAQELRRDLLAWGLICVEEGFHGQRPFLKITLTPEGEKMADLALEQEALANEARRRWGRA